MKERVNGLDFLRALAIFLVVFSHQISVLGVVDIKRLESVLVGQTGVSIFLVISGVLAALDTRSANSWICRRLVRIYPAYWLVMIIAFFLTWCLGYKSFDTAQVISQFIGTGLFTHPENLVNFATWYVSLLLVLYLLTYGIKKSGRQKLVALIVTTGSACLFLTSMDGLLVTHTLTYFLAYSLMTFSSRKQVSYSTLLLSVLLFLLATFETMLLCPGLAFMLCFLACRLKTIPERRQQFRNWCPQAISRIAGANAVEHNLHSHARREGFLKWLSYYSYELFLCHGIFLVGSQQFLGGYPIVSIPLGIVASLVFSVCLKYVVERSLSLFPLQVESTSSGCEETCDAK